MSTLEQLRRLTTIVADTGDFQILDSFKPQDGTTNPSHILGAAKNPKYKHLITEAVRYGISRSQNAEEQLEHAFIRLVVGFGVEILKHVPGRVSTEVDAIHSFHKDKTVTMAREIIELYEKLGVSRERVLIKIASTWEGFHACKILEQENIHCNMTLLFSTVQAKLAAEAGATLISPFVGRTMDWWQKQVPGKDYSGLKDPGVKLVSDIYKYYKSEGISTEIMAASLRNIDECVHLAGVDLMTINVVLLEELKNADYAVKPRLENHSNGHTPKTKSLPHYINDEAKFRLDLFEDAAATDKIAESLRIFFKDGEELKRMLAQEREAQIN
ncbi:transaldolase [Aaosphaeria arxii CBS 175.79]|uniref:transaldolase n=1 Tax=Aaosphaeria arxii CBS 175.79 TaxID=1450172 RepID=A0A6A5YA01_9PLEO|nr:transaldolase [Aaosphaeria arxii CBS 175.79]KAF2022415.1 transaldolase [Aaosphaeria arxii CBS 175.79]